MKILKLGKPKITNSQTLLKRIGCPNCGETKRSIEYGRNFMSFGISKSAKPKKYTTGIFKKKHWQVDKYHCLTCGCIWEGEPYEKKSV